MEPITVVLSLISIILSIYTWRKSERREKARLLTERIEKILEAKDVGWGSLMIALRRRSGQSGAGLGRFVVTTEDELLAMLHTLSAKQTLLHRDGSFVDGRPVARIWQDDPSLFTSLFISSRTLPQLIIALIDSIGATTKDERALTVSLVATRFSHVETTFLLFFAATALGPWEDVEKRLLNSPLTKELPGFAEFLLERNRSGMNSARYEQLLWELEENE